jgi:hypothetical protein
MEFDHDKMLQSAQDLQQISSLCRHYIDLTDRYNKLLAAMEGPKGTSEPVGGDALAWGIAIGNDLCELGINKDAMWMEYDRRCRKYPDVSRRFIELVERPTSPTQEPVGEVDQIDIDEDGERHAWVALQQGVELGQSLYAAPTAHTVEQLIATSQAVIDRWETPLWKDVPHTATYIYAMRDAVDAVKGATTSCGCGKKLQG